MSVGVKICGLTTVEAVAATAAGGAKFAGFVFYPPSPRDLSIEKAVALVKAVPPGITRVGVFVDPDDAKIEQILAKVPLDLLQFHGQETPDRLAEIKQRFKTKVMKAIKVAGEVDLQGAKVYFRVADWLMFDAKATFNGALPGGNALSFDWKLLREKNWPLPWMLSGGLTLDNMAEAATITQATVLDVSSGVERKPGEKDPAKVRAFLARAQQL
jgi:phosphoribosylanthranilate isomerase